MKQWGLGEGAVFWVWGPLMVLGTQYAIAETLSLGGLTLSVLLGLGPSIVIFGKHIDKADLDGKRPCEPCRCASGSALPGACWPPSPCFNFPC